MNTTEKERDKYSRIWEFEDYGNSPGLKWADMCWEIAKPFPNALLIDVGAGSGAATQELKKRGLDVEAFDITGIGWKQNDIRLKLGCLWRDKLDQHFDYAYCCDVMEH